MAEDLRLEARASRTVSMGATVDAIGALLGQTPRQDILSGEPVRAERLEVGARGLEARAAMREGARAVAVLVDAAAGVAGLIEPGSCVDVIVTVRPEERAIQANWVTETILQDWRVVAVEGARPAKADDGAGRSSPRPELLATLEVVQAHRGPLGTNAMVGLPATSETARRQRRFLCSRHSKRTDAEAIQGDTGQVEGLDLDGRKLPSRSRRGR